MPRRKRMTDGELAAIVRQAINRSDFFENSELAQNRKAALDTINGREQVQSLPGRSGAADSMVADMIDAVTAQLNGSFKSCEVAEFIPHGPADVAQARLEDRVCNQMLFDVNEGRVELQAAVRDALTLRNCFVACYPQTREVVEYESYPTVDADMFETIQAPDGPNQDVELLNVEPADVEDDGEGDPVLSVRLKRTTTFKRLQIEAIDPGQFVIEREYTSTDLQDCHIAGWRDFPTRSELIAEGYPRKTIDALPTAVNDTKVDSLSRNRDVVPPNWDALDHSQQKVQRFRLWMKVDQDNDGVAERRYLVFLGGTGEGTGAGTILENEVWPFVPIACGTGFLYPHRMAGMSIYDKLASLEKQKTKAFRQFEDNIDNHNFPELVVADNGVADTDVESRRSSGTIRVDSVTDVAPLPVGDIGLNSIQYMRYLDEKRAERAGAALDMQSGAAQLASESAHGTDRTIGVREQLSVLISDTLNETVIRQLFRIIHMNLRAFWQGETEFHVGASQFVSADPATWPMRLGIKVKAGMSETQRAQYRAVLGEHILQYEKLYEAGQEGILFSMDNYHEALLQWSEAGNVQAPRSMWIDPRTPEAQRVRAERAQAQQQAAKEAADREERLFRTQVLISDRENASRLAANTQDNATTLAKAVIDSNVKELEIRTNAADPRAAETQAELDADQDAARAASNQ